ncbi:MAG: DUF2752 domain-containing protein [Candidatus Nanopelagicales bacterium]
MSSTVLPAGQSRARRMAGPAAALLGTAAAWLVVAEIAPGDNGPGFCPWRSVSGLDCPFCGSTRAAACLAQGDLLAALDHNALLVLVVIPLAGIAWLRWSVRAWRGDQTPLASNRSIGILTAITLAWWALRLAVPWLASPLA